MRIVVSEFMHDDAVAESLPAASLPAGCPHLIFTPHVAGQTHESREHVAALAAEKIAAALAAA